MAKEDDKGEMGAELSEFLESGGSDSDEGTADDKTTVDTKTDDKGSGGDKTEDKVDTKVDDKKIDTKVDTKVATKKVVEEAEPEDDLSGMSDKELRSLARGLRTRVDEAHGKLVSAGVAIKTEQKVDTDLPAKTEKAIEKKVEAEVINFLKDVDMDEIIDKPEALNKLLVSVYNKAMTDATTTAVEKVIRSIPQLVVNYASRHATMAEMVRDFYSSNQDLVQVKRTVATVANEVAGEHPDWEVKNVFEEAAKRTRELLGLKKRTKVEPSDKGRDPAFVRKGAARKAAGADTAGMSDLQKDIAETLA